MPPRKSKKPSKVKKELVKGSILVVDDEPDMRDFLCETLKRTGYVVDSASNGAVALNKVKKSYYDMVITDLKMPRATGLEVLKETKKKHYSTAVVMMTGYGTIGSAVEAMKEGAFDYITKPFSGDEIRMVIDKAFEFRRLVDENQRLRQELEDKYCYANIIGKSKAIHKVFETISLVAPTKSTVLIQGESGTGKELVAKAIHYNSPRKSANFIRVNCAAIPDSLMESELFGHEKGAFTGAIRRARGRFEKANGGTLLLDEISEMSPNLQSKLLRVLQEMEFERLGDGPTQKVDVRIIATTNRTLRDEINKERFREDLFYRLNVVPIFMPPLRERREDILLLTEHFMEIYARENGKKITGITPDAMEMLTNHQWAGNVRELEHCIERAVVIVQEDKLQPKHLHLEGGMEKGRLSSLNLDQMKLDDLEKMMIYSALDREDGNKTKAAKELGISVRTLRNKLNRYETSPSRKKTKKA